VAAGERDEQGDAAGVRAVAAEGEAEMDGARRPGGKVGKIGERRGERGRRR
jgi:hypothetical protein